MNDTRKNGRHSQVRTRPPGYRGVADRRGTQFRIIFLSLTLFMGKQLPDETLDVSAGTSGMIMHILKPGVCSEPVKGYKIKVDR